MFQEDHKQLESKAAVDPTGTLFGYFMKSSAQVAKTYRKKLAKFPIITQDFNSMTLFRSNGEKERFEMDDKLYQALAEISHPPVVAHNILSSHDWKITEGARRQLKE